MKKFKRLIASLVATLMIMSSIICIETVNTKAVTEFSRTAKQIAAEMGNGINLGNTMEATCTWSSNPSVKDFETAWGQPVTTKAMITGMKKAGFDTLRIPVAWINGMYASSIKANFKNNTLDCKTIIKNNPSAKINDNFFKRIDEIIGYALDNDMYVILNDHWDYGWWSLFINDYDIAMKHYESMWTQIATHYKNYSEKLIFESANEELTAATASWESASSCLGFTKVNAINQKFVDIVRKTGGNNAKRYLLIAGVNTDITKTCNSSFKMPKDTIANHLMLSVHYYDPFPYTTMWEKADWADVDYDWGTAADKKDMENMLAKMDKFTNAGYPVIIGEYGVLPDYKYNRKKNDVEYTDYFLKLCEQHNFTPVLWDTNGDYNKSTCAMRYSDIAALYKVADKVSIGKLTSATGGMSVTWDRVKGAATYALYRSDKTTALTKTTALSYKDVNVEIGKSYKYTIKALDASGKVISSDTVGKTATYKPYATISSLTNSGTGITIKWSKITSATGYIIYRKTSSSASWTKLKTITSGSTVSYVDTSATGKYTYYYTVQAVRNTVNSNYNSGKSISVLAKPALPTLSNTSTGISVKWSAISGATGYVVYRKTGSTGSFKAIKTITGGSTVSYTDTSATTGTTYYYTIQATKSSGKSLYNTSGKAIKRLANQKIASMSNINSGVTFSWNKATGAAGYYVYRKTETGSYTLLKKITSPTTLKYTDTTAVNGTVYYYKVVAYSGNYTSSVTAMRIARLSTPTISSVSNTSSNAMTVKWGKNSKATGYQIKYVNGTTTKTVDVTSGSTVSKVISSLTKDKTYTVYVRAYKSVGGVKFYSNWSAAKTCKITK